LAAFSESLPAVLTGAGSAWSMLRGLLLFSGLAIAAVVALVRLFAHPQLAARARTMARHLPTVGSLARLADEAQAAALIAAFADSRSLALAPRAAAAVASQPYAGALTAAAADPSA